MFLSMLGKNGAKTKTRSEAVLEARDARKALAEAGSPEMHGLFFFARFCFFARAKKTASHAPQHHFRMKRYR